MNADKTAILIRVYLRSSAAHFSSHHIQTTIYLDCLAMDEAGRARAKEQDRIGDLFVGSERPGGCLRGDRIEHLTRRELLVEVVVDRAGRDGVDANALRGQLLRQSFRDGGDHRL